MEHSDLILALDKQQRTYPVERQSPHRVVCPRDAAHGALTVRKEGTHLICGKCEYVEVATLAQ